MNTMRLTYRQWKRDTRRLPKWKETDARWIQYLKERGVKRTRLDEITEELKDNGL